MTTYYIVSGGFDPLHEGHIEMIKDAALNSDGVILLLNSDEWLTRKKGKNFMSFKTRAAVCGYLKNVIDVIAFDDSDNSASDGIRKAREKYPDAMFLPMAETEQKIIFRRLPFVMNWMWHFVLVLAVKIRRTLLHGF